MVTKSKLAVASLVPLRARVLGIGREVSDINYKFCGPKFEFE
jgi:hypothetical protein